MSALREVFSGTAWVVAARWCVRGIGMVSTIVLARLLAPEDFGVIALAMFVVGLIEIVGDTGLVTYIIRHQDPQRSHFDTVFTLRLLTGLVLALGVFASAPYAAAFFSEPQVVLVIQCLALRPLLMGIENPGIIWFRKNMTFSKDSEFLVLNKLVSFVVTIAAAILLRNHWALVVGILSGAVVAVAQSYRMHPFRPRLDLSRAGEMWRHSSWMLFVSLFSFINTRVDEMIIGRVHSTTQMGFYAVGSSIAATPVQELVYPMTRVWVPAFAKLAQDKAALERTYRWIVSAVAILAFSVGGGLALVADDFAHIVLGPKWDPAVPLIRILAVAASLAALTMPLSSVLTATTDLRVIFGLTLLRTVLLLATMIPAAIWYGPAEVAGGRALATLATLLVTFAVFERVAGLPPLALTRSLGRPLLATLAMAGAVLSLQAALPEIPFLRLALCVAAGAASFVAALLALWVLAGRPDAVERDALAWITAKLRRQPGPGTAD
jgi:O-antigen/teichoic acid export membrane protein